MNMTKKTPLFDTHVKLGARMAPFGGWDMPIQYEGILVEHDYTRKVCGIFDICHMGEFELSGPTAEQDLERLLTQSVKAIAIGQCKYGFLLNDKGGVIDDLTCYRLAADHFMLVVNAGTCTGDSEWISNRLSPGTRFHDISSWTGKLDVQGPESKACLEEALGVAIPELKYFHFTRINLLGVSCLLSRTGYTGEWGYELYMPIEATQRFWDKLTASGRIKPVGLGARDTLRLEVGYPLYGHELSDRQTPVAAFGRNFMDTGKDFIGRSGVMIDQEKGTARTLVGLTLASKRAARADDLVYANGRTVGVITSGSLAPSLGVAVGMAYIDREFAQAGTAVEIDVRGSKLPAAVTALPFYKNGTARRKAG